MTVVVATKPGLAAGTSQQVKINPDGSFWANLLGQNYSGTVKPGTITIGGSLSVSNVVPGAGLLPAGFVVKLLGSGFDSSTQVVVDEVLLSTVFVNSGEIDLKLAQQTDMQGERIRVRNKDSQVTYFSYLRATPLPGSSGRPLLAATTPIFANPLPLGFLATGTSGSYTGLALQNTSLSTVDVSLDLLSASGQVLASSSVQLPSGSRHVREVSELFPGTASIPAGSVVRVTPKSPIQMLGLIGDDTAKTVAPLSLSTTAPATVALSASSPSLRFDYQAGGPLPANQSVALASSGAPLSFTVSQSPAAPWLTVSPGNGTTPATLTVAVNPSALAAGTYNTNIQVAPNGAATLSIPVTLAVADRVTPVVSATVSAANQQTGALSPGEVITVYGSFPGVSAAGLTLDATGKVSTTLSGTRLLFDGFAAPLTYVSSTQINAVVPYEISDRGTTRVQAEIAGVQSAVVSQPVAAAAPAIFTADASGSGAAAALNQDFSFNNLTPALRGSVISIYATGEGRTSPPGVTGGVTGSDLKNPVLQVSAKIGGQPADVQYAGSAPGLVTGVLQVNVKIPDNAPTGAVPIAIVVGTAASQPGVTISIR
jgi:uncharacterized protein (TIGR03437 family)